MAETTDASGSGSAPPPSHAARYFWHEKAWTSLTRDFAKLPHALLFSGMSGLGKGALAWRIAKSLLCAEPLSDAQPCGVCASCRRFAAGTHPDLKYVAPLEDSVVIVVGQIREVGEFCTLKPHTALRKVIIIEFADAMNTSAANAFLKVLEEPPPNSFLLLITPRPAHLPATIRSRCMSIGLRPPGFNEAAAWLKAQGLDDSAVQPSLRLAGGAPLRALGFAQSDELRERDEWMSDVAALRAGRKDPLSCARDWKRYGVDRCLGWFQRYVADLVTESIVGDGIDKNRNLLKHLLRYFDVLSEARKLANGPLDELLLLEDISIRWSRLFRSVV